MGLHPKVEDEPNWWDQRIGYLHSPLYNPINFTPKAIVSINPSQVG